MLRAATASSSQQQLSGGGGGGRDGLMLKQAQCNVFNPCTGQLYTMHELVTEIRFLQQQGARNADDIAGIAAATRDGLEQLRWSSGRGASDVCRSHQDITFQAYVYAAARRSRTASSGVPHSVLQRKGGRAVAPGWESYS
jgi:hypothetical protein